MRPVWKGAISFGLVNIPVNLMNAEDPSELDLFMMDGKDHARIKYQRVNAATGQEVAWEDIVKAYEFPDGSFVIVEDADYEKADPKASKTLDIEYFVPIADVDPRYLEKPYYITPVKGGEKPYILLREAMKEAGKAAIGRLTLRTKQSMAMILPLDNVLVMIRLRYAQEVRSPEGLDVPPSSELSAKEMKLALTLIDGLSQAWAPEEFRDVYTDALLARLEAKARRNGQELPEEEEPEEVDTAKVEEIIDLLRKSLERKAKPKPAAPDTRKAPAESAEQSAQGKASAKRKSS